MRKKPVQQRARMLVDSLIDAAGEVVARDGLEALTTVRVAARAGVSVGSLYQYFDNKNMLVAALMDRVNGDLIAAVDQVAAQHVGDDPQRFARALLEAAFAVFETRQGLARELMRHWHRLDIARGLHRFEQRMLDLLRAYALAHLREHPVDPSPARAFILINSVVFTLLRYLSEPSPLMFQRAELIDELAAMAARLISAPR
ncbi:TetR/AcrR family transcriptional regulator [Nevskia sp.]|uniref:TetR/AcrR family transcriptional regulator n=1 Tax=Nevskia sp. TaxID=1929292 RepID=UPI0026000BB3|nr:TetR/AcrR family transcriptional regulator [Nevskia sp.]